MEHLATRQHVHSILHKVPGIHLDSRLKQRWDLIILLTILYQAIFTTFVLVYKHWPPFSLPCNIVVNVIFVLDIILKLNLADEHIFTSKSSFSRVQQYARSGWFLVDLVAAVPADLIINFVQNVPFGTRLACHGIRLVKISVVVGAGQLFVAPSTTVITADYVDYYLNRVSNYKGIFWLLLALHGLGLIKALISGNPGPTPYGAALYWTWAMISSGEGVYKTSQPLEYLYAGILELISLLVQGLVVSQLSVRLLKADVQGKLKSQMLATSSFIRTYKIPSNMEQEILSYQYHSLTANLAGHYIQVLRSLPKAMKDEINIYIKISVIEKVPMFKHLGMDIKMSLSTCLTHVTRQPNHLILQQGQEGREMYFLMHGFADVIAPNGIVVHTMKRGQYFGEIALLLPNTKRTASIRALTFCELLKLEKSSFLQLMKECEHFSRAMQEEGNKRMTMIATMPTPPSPTTGPTIGPVRTNSPEASLPDPSWGALQRIGNLSPAEVQRQQVARGLQAPTRQVAPKEQVEAFNRLRASGLTMTVSRQSEESEPTTNQPCPVIESQVFREPTTGQHEQKANITQAVVRIQSRLKSAAKKLAFVREELGSSSSSTSNSNGMRCIAGDTIFGRNFPTFDALNLFIPSDF